MHAILWYHCHWLVFMSLCGHILLCFEHSVMYTTFLRMQSDEAAFFLYILHEIWNFAAHLRVWQALMIQLIIGDKTCKDWIKRRDKWISIRTLADLSIQLQCYFLGINRVDYLIMRLHHRQLVWTAHNLMYICGIPCMRFGISLILI